MNPHHEPTHTSGPNVLVAHPGVPWRGFQNMVAATKAAPDTINHATSGAGTLSHIPVTLLQQLGGFKLTHVPYRGGGPAVQAALAGEVPLLMASLPTFSAHIRAGALRPLAVSTEAESPLLPRFKGFAQQGFAGFEAPTWFAFFGRAGTPEPVPRRTSEALNQILVLPDVRDRIEQSGANVVAGGPERCRRFVTREVERWGRVIRENNISLEG